MQLIWRGFSLAPIHPPQTRLLVSFQVSRIEETYKPELAPLGFGDAISTSGASSSADTSNMAMPILASCPTGSSTLVVLPLDEMNTPISAFKGKGQAIKGKTPSKSPCPPKARCKLFAEPPKTADPDLPTSATKLSSQTEEAVLAGNVVQATSVPKVGQGAEATATEDPKAHLSDHDKIKRVSTTGKGAGAPKKARQ